MPDGNSADAKGFISVFVEHVNKDRIRERVRKQASLRSGKKENSCGKSFQGTLQSRARPRPVYFALCPYRTIHSILYN